MGLFASLSAQDCRCSDRNCTPSRSNTSSSADRLHFQLGGAANYTYGELNEASQTVSEDFVNGQATAFLGIRLQPRQRRRSNVLGVWGTMGFNNSASVDRLMQVQGIAESVDPSTDLHELQEWEVGFLFKEWFRVSGGKGFQRFSNLSQETVQVDYYTASAGFSWNLSPSIKWNTTATMLFGEDFQEVAFRPSTGISFRFNFF